MHVFSSIRYIFDNGECIIIDKQDPHAIKNSKISAEGAVHMCLHTLIPRLKTKYSMSIFYSTSKRHG